VGAVGQADEGGQAKDVAVGRRVGSDRRVAGRVERGDQRPLRRQRDQGGPVGEIGRGLDRSAVVRAGLQGEAALARSWHELGERHPLVAPAEALQAGPGEHDRVEVPVGQPAQTGVDVATQLAHVQVRSQREQLRPPPHASGAHHGALAERSQRLRPAQRVARVGALGDAHDREPGRQHARHVLGRVDGEVDVIGEERLLDLLHEA
jgi:hypothetical protein